MKKLTALLLIFAMIFAFGACKKEEEKVPVSAPSVEGVNQKTDETVYAELREKAGIEENYHYNELKSDDGVVRFIVKISLPKLTSKTCSAEVAEMINHYYENEVYEKDLNFAKINVESAKNYMTKKDSDKPWAIQTSFEVRFFGNDLVCIVLKRSVSYGGNATPVISAKCFNLTEGNECSSNDFYIKDVDEATKAIILDTIKDNAKYELNPKSVLTDEQVAKIDNVFDPDNGYYITDKGITFFFNKNQVDPSQFGTYEFVFFWAEVEYIYKNPMSE